MHTDRWTGHRAVLAALATAALLGQALAASGAAPGTGSHDLTPTAPSTVNAAAQAPTPGLRYEPNVGQFHEDVAYALHGPGSGLWLTDAGAAVLAVPEEVPAPDEDREPAPVSYVRMRLAGAAEDLAWQGEGELDGVSNYLVGEPDEWVTGVPHVKRVVAEDAYPGVDVVWHADGGTPKFDLRVEPGASADDARLAFDGVEDLRVRADGALVLETATGDVVKPAPYAYQPTEDGPHEVQAAYDVEDGVVTFDVGDHDPSEPLVVDPEISYGTYVGGSSLDLARDVAVDDEGHAHLVGRTRSTDFPTSEDAYRSEPVNNETEDGFATKLTADGTEIVYSTYLGTEEHDHVDAAAIDDGQLVLAGDSRGFGTGSDAEGFVARLLEDGTDLDVLTTIGSDGDDRLRDLAVADGLYLTGFTDGAAIGLDGAGGTATAGERGVVAKLDRNATELRWTRSLGDGDLDPMALDAGDGRAVVAGNALADTLDTSPDAYQPNIPGERSVFAVAYDADGERRWATYAGNDARDWIQEGALALDGREAVLAAATFAANDEWNLYAVRLAADGTDARFHERLPASDDTFASGVATYGYSGHALVTGSTTADDYPVTADAFQKEHRGEDALSPDGVLTVFDADGEVDFSTYWGGEGSDRLPGVDVTASGTTTLGATTRSDLIFTSQHAFQVEHPGGGASGYVATVQPFSPAGAPSDVRAMATDRGEVTVAWDAPENGSDLPVDSYHVYRSRPGQQLDRLVTVDGDVTRYVDEGLRDGTEYVYAVQGENPVGEGPLSEQVTPVTPPTAPENLTAETGPLHVGTPTTPGSVELEWDPPGDPDDDELQAYHVYREGAGEDPIATVPGSQTAYEDENLALVNVDETRPATYTYRVTAANGGGEGPPSEPACSNAVPLVDLDYCNGGPTLPP